MELLGALATGWMSLLILILSWMGKGRLDRIESRLDTGFREVRSEIAALRSEHGAEIGSLRSDVTQIALALGAARPDTG